MRVALPLKRVGRLSHDDHCHFRRSRAADGLSRRFGEIREKPPGTAKNRTQNAISILNTLLFRPQSGSREKSPGRNRLERDGHQEVHMEVTVLALQGFAQPTQVRVAISVIEETSPAIVATLDNMQRHTVDVDARTPRQRESLAEIEPLFPASNP